MTSIFNVGGISLQLLDSRFSIDREVKREESRGEGGGGN